MHHVPDHEVLTLHVYLGGVFQCVLEMRERRLPGRAARAQPCRYVSLSLEFLLAHMRADSHGAVVGGRQDGSGAGARTRTHTRARTRARTRTRHPLSRPRPRARGRCHASCPRANAPSEAAKNESISSSSSSPNFISITLASSSSVSCRPPYIRNFAQPPLPAAHDNTRTSLTPHLLPLY